MITSLAQWIAGFLLKNNAIESEKLDIYIYGFEVMISSICGFLIASFMGAVFSRFWESMLFLIVFVSLRSYCGGYHADTYLRCNSIFAGTMLAVMLFLTYTPEYSFLVHPAVCAGGLCAALALAPMESPYKPLDAITRRKCRIISIILLLLYGCAGCALHSAYFRFSITIDASLLVVTASMLVEVILKRGERNETC